MKVIAVFFSICILNLFGTEPTTSIKTSAEKFEVDALEYIYLYESGTIRKYDNRGIEKSTFNRSDFGDISSVDISNSMKTVVYYQNAEKIFILDNALSHSLDPIDLSLDYPGNIAAACHSVNNHIWLYNQSSQKLIRTDYRLNVASESTPLNNWIAGEIEVNAIKEKNDLLYVSVQDKGIFVFDIFGTYYRKFMLGQIDKFEIENDDLIYSVSGKLTRLNMKTLESKKVDFDMDISGVQLMKNKNIYCLESGELLVYKLN